MAANAWGSVSELNSIRRGGKTHGCENSIRTYSHHYFLATQAVEQASLRLCHESDVHGSTKQVQHDLQEPTDLSAFLSVFVE